MMLWSKNSMLIHSKIVQSTTYLPPVALQFHYKTDQGIKCFHRNEADTMSMTDPDFAIRDLYNAIADGKFPSYTMWVTFIIKT